MLSVAETKTELRPYQTEVISQCERIVAAGRRHILLVAPTGSGKTIIAARIIKNTVDQGRRVLIFAHRREIVQQTSDKLLAEGVEHGIIQAGFPPHLHFPVQVATIQTLAARTRSKRLELPPADLIIVDEGHHAPAKTYRAAIAAYPDAVLIGLTATPCRGDGRGLGGIFEVIVECPQVAELTAAGHLVPAVIYAPTTERLDLRGVRVETGDYVENQLAARVDRDELVGDIVTQWHRYAEQRRTVIFAVGVAHSMHIASEFRKAGVRAEHIDGATPKADRDAVLARLASGETQVVTNCLVLCEGFDLPVMGCIVLARPTKKMGLYRQMIGRALRPAEGKADAIVLDHSGAVFAHGFPDDPVEWTLDPERRAASPKHEARLRSGHSSRLLECSQCGALRVVGEKCRHCGFLPKRPPEAIVFADGDLGRVDRNRVAAMTEHDRARWHSMLAAVAADRGYKPGWIGFKYKEKFGHWPPTRDVDPIEPSPEVLSWVRSRAIAYAKARQKAGAT
jgi:superfamily II DNA or RNA helicase